MLLYIQLANKVTSDEFLCAIAKTIQEAAKQIEDGFEYVTEMEGCKLFRKRQ